MFGLLVCQVGRVCVYDTLISLGPEHEHSVLVCRKYFSGNDSIQSEEQKEIMSILCMWSGLNSAKVLTCITCLDCMRLVTESF